jgi:signal transduction histidine kinase
MSGLDGVPAMLQRQIPIVVSSGFGMARMRERLNRIGGKLDMTCSPGKTIVRAIIPSAPGRTAVASTRATDRA